MTLAIAIVRQPSLDSYGPLRPFRAPVRVRPCACGVSLIQYDGEDPVVIVGNHNAHQAHQAWRERSG